MVRATRTKGSSLERDAHASQARNARGVVRRTAEIAPFTAPYAFDGATWITRVDAPKLELRIRPDRVALVAVDGPVVCLFERRCSQAWCAVIWRKSDDVREAVAALLERIREQRPGVVVLEPGPAPPRAHQPR